MLVLLASSCNFGPHVLLALDGRGFFKLVVLVSVCQPIDLVIIGRLRERGLETEMQYSMGRIDQQNHVLALFFGQIL